MKSSITKCPILHLPDFSKVFHLRTDASNHFISAILMQETNNELFPVSFASKKLSIGEQKYWTTEKVFGHNWAVKKFRNYLHGIEFILETDHHSLQYLDKVKYINGRIMRWAMLLQQYRFKVNVIKGAHNHAADYLSRVVYDVWLVVDYWYIRIVDYY